mmetsp:Transcript_2075/g.7237  ORF Transcript_2075/g.7237 Transcript_2075/m.7237 type:complete len:211 (-) Transcript_2075:467-1099(-)
MRSPSSRPRRGTSSPRPCSSRRRHTQTTPPTGPSSRAGRCRWWRSRTCPSCTASPTSSRPTRASTSCRSSTCRTCGTPSRRAWSAPRTSGSTGNPSSSFASTRGSAASPRRGTRSTLRPSPPRQRPWPPPRSLPRPSSSRSAVEPLPLEPLLCRHPSWPRAASQCELCSGFVAPQPSPLPFRFGPPPAALTADITPRGRRRRQPGARARA